jgi:hypothetical protein
MLAVVDRLFFVNYVVDLSKRYTVCAIFNDAVLFFLFNH